MKRLGLVFITAALVEVAACPLALSANSQTASMAVSTTVTAYCSLSTQPLVFGNVIYGPRAATASTSLIYTCAAGETTPLVLTSSATGALPVASAGTASNANVAMANASLASLVAYTLFEPDGSTPLASGGTVVPLTHSAKLFTDGVSHVIDLTATVAVPTAPVGSYSNTLTFTINS